MIIVNYMEIVVCRCSKSFVKKNKDYFGYHSFDISPLTNGKSYSLIKVEYEGINNQIKFYTIKDNFCHIRRYDSNMFPEISENRDKVLKSLLS